MCLEEQFDEERLDRRRIVRDPVVARRRLARHFEPVQGRLASDRRAVRARCRELAGHDRHHRIVAQFVVIVQILVAQREAEHPLHDQRRDPVLDQRGPAVILETRGQAVDEADRAVRRAEQQRARV